MTLKDDDNDTQHNDNVEDDNNDDNDDDDDDDTSVGDVELTDAWKKDTCCTKEAKAQDHPRLAIEALRQRTLERPTEPRVWMELAQACLAAGSVSSLTEAQLAAQQVHHEMKIDNR